VPVLAAFIIGVIVFAALIVLTVPLWGWIVVFVRRRKARLRDEAETLPEDLRGGNRFIVDQVCPGCGKRLVRELAVCPSCGATLDD
jgi:ribosomal protein L32